MKFEFNSIDEIKEFMSNLKGTRGGKSDKAEAEGAAPAPLAPPAGNAQAFNPGNGAGFAPPAGGAGQAGAAPFAPGAPALAPEVQALVTRVITRLDSLIAAGQDANQMLAWFRTECVKAGVNEAANATMEQIKQACLPKLPVQALDSIAKLTGA